MTELDEVVVDGRRPLRDPQTILDWLQRLPGRYVVEGTIDLPGQAGVAAPIEMRGESRCSSYAPTPAVHCELTLPWRVVREAMGDAAVGGVANLDSMLTLLAYDDDHIGVRHMTVDSRGNAEAGQGYLLSTDEFASRTECMSLPGDCERVIRIKASPDLKDVKLEIDFQVDHKTVSKLDLIMHRVIEDVPNPSPQLVR